MGMWLSRAIGCVLIKSMRLCRAARIRTGLHPAVGLLLLSALWAAAWLLWDWIPHDSGDTLSSARDQAMLFSVFAGVAACLAAAQGVSFPKGRRALACAGVGAGLFVIPAVLAACVEGRVSELNRVAVLSLTPVFAVVLEPHLNDGGPGQGKGALAGALAAVAGILFLFPLDPPGSFRSIAALCVLLAAAFSIAVTNCLAVREARSLAEGSTLGMAAQAGGASAICFAAAAVSTPGGGWRWSTLATQIPVLLLIDVPALFLLFWLMRRLAASRMTARFLLAPLFAILGGMVLQPIPLSARAWLGLALLAGGAGWLAFAPGEKTEV